MICEATQSLIVNRKSILTSIAKELEFRVHRYSATAEGYETRLKEQVTAIKLLQDELVWDGQCPPSVDEDEYEDAVWVLGVVRRFSTTLAGV